MSKSENDDPGRVCLMDKPEDIMRLFKRAITDCDSEVRYDPEHKKGVSNLMTIYSAATGRTFAEIEAEFAGRGYGDFKKTVGEAVAAAAHPRGEPAPAGRQGLSAERLRERRAEGGLCCGKNAAQGL